MQRTASAHAVREADTRLRVLGRFLCRTNFARRDYSWTTILAQVVGRRGRDYCDYDTETAGGGMG